MTARWFVAEAERRALSWQEIGDGDRMISAAVFATGRGYEAYIPLMPAMRKIGAKLVEVSVPRFGAYVFLRPLEGAEPWSALTSWQSRDQRFRRILCNADGVPIPVPDIAIDKVRAFRPAPIVMPQNRRYQPGERVMCLIAGMRKEAVFVEYCGNRPMVRTWIFGAERVTEVASAEIELVDVDIG